jgi:hypothetical protein
MTVRFRNPWVDPRVLDVQPAELESYLRGHGWQEAEAPGHHTKRFLSPPAAGDRTAVLVPTARDDGPLLNQMVECVGAVAGWEGRYAGDLLDDLLGAATAARNGTAGAHPSRVP